MFFAYTHLPKHNSYDCRNHAAYKLVFSEGDLAKSGAVIAEIALCKIIVFLENSGLVLGFSGVVIDSQFSFLIIFIYQSGSCFILSKILSQLCLSLRGKNAFILFLYFSSKVNPLSTAVTTADTRCSFVKATSPKPSLS